MSHNLSKECDSLLTATAILDHHYGVPDVTKSHLKFTASNETLQLESQYHKLFNKLSHKLNKLIYLNKLQELSRQSDDTIEEYYLKVLNNKLDSLPILEYSKNGELSKLQAIRKFYEFQIDNFKTGVVLNEYLQITLPILRSIHKLDTGITTTELNISQNLSSLYSGNEATNANVNKLIKLYQESNDINKNINILVSSLSHRLDSELKVKLKELNNLHQELKKEHNALLDIKEKQINEIIKENDDQLYEKFNDLVSEWSYISIMCELLSGFVISLPIDWYQDRSLCKIVFKIEKISLKIAKYELIINRTSFNTFNSELLYMIDLEEETFRSESSDED